MEFDAIVVFDVETSGLDSRSDSIIEFGAVRVENGSVSAELDTLVKLPQDRRLPGEVTMLTGITREMLTRDGIEQQEAANQIAEMLSGESVLLIAYNAQFDLCFLYKLLKRYGRESALKGVKMLDALTVYKDRRPYPHKLSDAVRAYGLSGQNTHRAIDDARATWELVEKMRAEYDDLKRYINLFGYNPKYGVSGPRISSVTYREQEYNSPLKLYEKG